VGKDFALVGLVVLPRLEQHAVERLVLDGVGGQVADVGAEGEGGAAAAVAGLPARLHRQEELDPGPGEVPEVVAVDVPSEDAERSHGASVRSTRGSRNNSSASA